MRVVVRNTAAVVLPLVGPASIAGAADSSGATASGRYCAVEAAVITPGTGMTEAAPKPACFDSESAVWTFVTGASLPAGTTSLAQALTTRSDAGAQSRSASPMAASGTTVLAVLYQDVAYGGGALALYSSSGNTCPNGSTYGFSNLGSYSWNDITSSVSGNNCQVMLYQNINYGGSTFKCNGSCSSVGSMNDQASSVILKKLNS